METHAADRSSARRTSEKQRDRAAVRIACVRDHLEPSGGTDALLRVFQHLDRRRIDLDLVVLRPRDECSEAFEAAGIKLHHLARKHHVLAALRALRPQQLFLSGPKSQVWGGIAARLLGLPSTLFFNHMMSAGRIGRLTFMIQRTVSSSSDHAIAVSQAVEEWVKHRYGMPGERIKVIYPEIDVDRFADAVAAESPGHPVIAIIGRVVFDEKGQDLMVAAMPKILARFPDAVLNVIGDGRDLPALHALIECMGVQDSVRLLGRRRDIAEQVKAATVIAVPSTCDEAFSLVAIEAAAAGRPSVAFASGGLVESVRDGETGMIVPKRDVDALAAAILELCAEPERANAMSEAARAHARAFTLERRVEETTAHFERLAAAAPT